MLPRIEVRDASSIDIDTARTLLREYAAHLISASGEGHVCLTEYEQELAALPGAYAPPGGALLLAFVDDEPAGCVAMKPLIGVAEYAGEMKRLWVRPRYRGLRLGTALAEALIRRAIGLDYKALYLDTLPAAMQSANRIYRELGFEPIDRYSERLTFTASAPIEVAFFRLDLTKYALEERDRQGYSKQPAETGESQLWEAEAAWPPE